MLGMLMQLWGFYILRKIATLRIDKSARLVGLTLGSLWSQITEIESRWQCLRAGRLCKECRASGWVGWYLGQRSVWEVGNGRRISDTGVRWLTGTYWWPWPCLTRVSKDWGRYKPSIFNTLYLGRGWEVGNGQSHWLPYRWLGRYDFGFFGISIRASRFFRVLSKLGGMVIYWGLEAVFNTSEFR